MHHFCVPGGLRRRGGEPLSRLRDPRAAARRERPAAEGLRGAEELHQGDRQGHAEGDVQDGHLDLPVLLRRADLRRRRPAFGLRREVLHRHRHHHRGRGLAGDRRGDGAPALRRLRRQADLSQHARSGRRLCLPPARRGPCLDARQRRQAAARGARQLVGRVQGLRHLDQRAERAAADHPRPDAVQVGRAADPARGGRARGRHRAGASPPAR